MKQLKIAPLAVLLLLAGFAPHQGRAPVRWALIVGVGDYQNYERGEPGGDLPGATNDARNMHEVLLARWGFEEAHVRLLLDLEATRAAIEESFTEWLPSVVQPGDLVLFYYSGHGSQVWDRNGDEPDGLDETICPTDVLRNSSRNDVRDDELAGWLEGVPTSNITVILDSCHSGTGTRAMAPFVRTRSLGREAATDLASERPETGTRSAFTNGGAAEATGYAFGDGVLEIASAQSDQYALETVFDGVHGRLPHAGGAFTTPMVHHLWQVPIHTTYEEIFELTLQTMKQRNFEQNPQLGSRASRRGPLFALPPAPQTQLAAAGEAPSRVEPGATSAEAVPAPEGAAAPDAGGSSAEAQPATGSTGAAAPPAEPERLPEGGVRVLSADASSARLGGGAAAGVTAGSLYRVGERIYRVTAVEANRATATLAGRSRGHAGLFGPSVAELIAYQPVPPTLRVTVADLSPQLRTAVGAALTEVTGVLLQSNENDPAELMVRPEGQGYAVLGVDGSLRHLIEGTDAAAGIAAALTKELSALAVATLENPTRPFPVRLAFGGPANRFRLDDVMEFELTAGRDGYVTIVDVDPAGTVAVIFPNGWDADNRVSAGTKLTVPTAAMGFEFRAAEPTGRGIVRVFVTDRPLPIATTDGVAIVTAEEIAEALRAASGPPAVEGSAAIPVDSWATASIVYEITR